MKRILVQFFLLVFVLPVYSEEMGVGDKSVDKISAEYKVEIHVKKDNSLVVFVHGDGWKSIKAKNKKVIDDESFIKLLVLGERIKDLRIETPISTRSLSAVSKCSSLEVLSLGEWYDEEKNWKLFKDLNRLKWVTFHGKVSKITLNALPSKTIESLTLIGCPICDSDIDGLKNMDQLQNLHLSGTNITNRGVEILTAQKHDKIEFLDLRETSVSDQCLSYLTRMTSLRTLLIWNTKCTDKELVKLQKMMPNCEVRYTQPEE